MLGASDVGAPHKRERIWIVANARRRRRSEPGEWEVEQSRGAEAVGTGEGDDHVADADHERCSGQHALLRAETTGRNAHGLPEASGSGAGGFWHPASWITGHDGKARRVEPGIRLLAHGVSARVGKVRAYGNAIVPQVAAEVIGAYMDCMP